MTGPLAGIRIIEIAGIGPGPFAGMMLADHGAEVIRVERPAGGPGRFDASQDILLRSRRLVRADLKNPAGVQMVRDLAANADGLIEGFRPGVMERLGLGPDVLLRDNRRLVYGRMTGWGQTGPLAAAAGHDIDYIAITGALHAIGPAGGKPVPPLNLVGDFGGGGMMLAFGMLAALLNVKGGGEGQVVDCAMTDGAALLMAMTYSFRAQSLWQDRRGGNALDGGAPFYDTYETSDGKYLAVGAIEPQFYARLRQGLGVADDPAFDQSHDPAAWPAQKARFAALFLARTRDDWCAVFDGDACVAPVLSMDEAPAHPHNAARATFVEAGGILQPAPAPRYSATPAVPPRMMARGQDDTTEILAALGSQP